MELVIGKKRYEAVKLTADFPIVFYKETGRDIFKLETNFGDNMLEDYETMINLAYYLSGENMGIDEFKKQFTPKDIIDAYADIFACYSATTESEVVSETEKK